MGHARETGAQRVLRQKQEHRNRKTFGHAKRNKGTLGYAERNRTVGHAMQTKKNTFS
jgi:hypothetical protein